MSEREPSFRLSQREFSFICQFAYDCAGIVLGDSKREMVYRRLTRVLRDRGLQSFGEYCQLLKADPSGEQDYFVNAITTNLTSFFREDHHFRYLLENEIPRLIELKRNSGKRLRIWSSASSTGEEPYSIAMTLYSGLQPHLSNWDAKILATDVDSNVLEKAKNGVYEEGKIESVPEGYKRDFFIRGKGTNQNSVKVHPKIQRLITFKRLNLLHEWPMKGPFDVIFCRNVIIYFDKPTQQELFERFYTLLEPNGLLILGHSENLGSFQKYFENVGRTMFRKPMLSRKCG